MTVTFGQWQREYAARGIATFPVREKRPAVKGYLKLGLRASEQLAVRFSNEPAFGLACRRNRISVLDVDSSDEGLLADVMSELGPSPFVVRSGSGNFQAWYRHNGERRQVRPDPTRPIDILGDGFVVAPPSVGSKGRYSIICGQLDDLLALPTMRVVGGQCPAMQLPQSDLLAAGRRNEALWRECMKRARGCASMTELMEAAVHLNRTMFYEPLPDVEVLKVVASAWDKEVNGENWFGRGGRVIHNVEDIDGLLIQAPDAFVLLTILKRNHWGRDEFVIANAMHESMPGGGWRRERFAAARRHLLPIAKIEEVRPASRHYGPAIYRFKGAQK